MKSLARCAALLAPLLYGCATQHAARQETTPPPAGSTAPSESQTTITVHREGSPSDARELVRRGVALINARQCARAMSEGLDPALAAYERDLPRGGRLVAGRSDSLTMLNSLQLAAAGVSEVHAIGTAYPDVLYLRAFCLVDGGDIPGAERALRRALEIIPNDFVYASELGHVLQLQRRWPDARAAFEQAIAGLDALHEAAPDLEQQAFFGVPALQWRARAMRGVGYVQAEMGDFGGAEATYRRVLVLVPGDQRATEELRWVQEQRAGQTAPPR